MFGREKCLLALGLATLLALSGCCCRKQQCCYTAGPGSTCPPSAVVPRPFPPPGSGPIQAAPNYPNSPGPLSGFPVAPGVPGPPVVPANPSFSDPPPQPMPSGQPLQPARADFPERTEARLPNDPPRDPVQLTPPVPAPPSPGSPPTDTDQRSIAQQPPQNPEPPTASVNPPPAQGPSSSEKRDQPATPPLDIPGFALAKTRVATGLKPFPDGIAWLQANGYRTVLHVRAPGEDDKAAQELFKKYNLRYLTLEIAPGTLTRDAVEAFTRFVTDQSNYPIFVFDKDGAMTGALWLVYFRLFEGVSEEKARLEAARLGWKPDQDADHRAMADAAARYLRSQNP